MYNVHANDADMKFFMKFLSDGNSFQENTKMLISLVSYSLELDSVFFLRTFFDTSSVQDEDWLLSSSLTLFLLITKLLGSEILFEICHLRSWMIYTNHNKPLAYIHQNMPGMYLRCTMLFYSTLQGLLNI